MTKFKLLERGKVDDVFDKIKPYLPDMYQNRSNYYTLVNSGATLGLEVGDFQGVVLLTDLITGLKAQVHVYIWDKTVRRRDDDARFLLKQVFMLLDLKRLEARPPEQNAKACAYAERMGFKREGVMRKAARYNNQLQDLVMYSLLEEDLNG